MGPLESETRQEGAVSTGRLPVEVNVPNALTVLRLVLTPVVVWLAVSGTTWLALALFLVAAATDYLDGMIARTYGMQTRLGALLDPIADKFLVVVMLVALPCLGTLPFWFSAVVIARDLLLGGGVLLLHRAKRRFEVNPSRMSKYATTGEFIVISLGIAGTSVPPASFASYLGAAMAGTTLLVAISLAGYGLQFIDAMRVPEIAHDN